MPLPAESGHLDDLAAGTEGQIYFIRRPTAHGKPSLRRFDLKKREEETLADGIDDFQISADRKKILYASGGTPDGGPPGPLTLGIVDAGQVHEGRWRTAARGDLGAGRAPRRMGPDPPRSLADQPRLLLRDEHARCRLECRLAQV